MAGWATTINFACAANDLSSILPNKVLSRDHRSHSSFFINNRAMSTFHWIGRGLVHMEQLAAWLVHPWNSMKNYFQVTEDYLGGIITCVAQQLMHVARILEHGKMLETAKM
eukprot:1954051-Ditylum_brightwellii.AAC.1